MTMLEGWIYRGQLDDPYHEFMVREEQGLAKENVGEDFNAAYWDKRCVVVIEFGKVYAAGSEWMRLWMMCIHMSERGHRPTHTHIPNTPT